MLEIDKNDQTINHEYSQIRTDRSGEIQGKVAAINGHYEHLDVWALNNERAQLLYYGIIRHYTTYVEK